MIALSRFLTAMLTFVILCSFRAPVPENERMHSYINQYKDLAIAEMLRTGVPASITLAQGILETGGGQSDLANHAFNHFGIKCKDEWTGDKMYHDDDSKGECFRKYSSVEDSYKDHSEFLKSRPHYAFLFKLDPTDYEGWAKGLKKAGYATNPQYAGKLIKIIVENNLQQYTLLALNYQHMRETELFAYEPKNTPHSEPKVVAQKVQPLSAPAVKIEKSEVNVEKPVVTKTNTSVPQNISKKPVYPAGKIFTINDTKVIFAEAGSSLFALANRYNVAYKKILEFNHLPETDILAVAQLIFIEKKPKKGASDFHVMQPWETLFSVAQNEGIQLASLIEYNRLQPGMEPAAGEKVYLKAVSPNTPKLVSHATGNTNATLK
jgi:LysM repeat protein